MTTQPQQAPDDGPALRVVIAEDEAIIRMDLRETLEEACAKVEIGHLFAVVDVVDAGQVHFFYTAKLVSDFSPGAESLECRMFAEDEIPWDDIAFQSGRYALEKYFEDRGRNRGVHVHELRRSHS